MKNEGTEPVGEEYKSPVRKLIPFFKNSRDKWKEKCIAAKYQVKLLRNRLRQMEKRDAGLKQKVNTLERELQKFRDKEQKLLHEVASLKKRH